MQLHMTVAMRAVDAEFGQRRDRQKRFNGGVQIHQGKLEQGQHRDERRGLDHQRRCVSFTTRFNTKKQNHNHKEPPEYG